MNGIHTRKEAEDLIYRSYLRAVGNIKEKRDAEVRKPELTRKLFRLLGSPDRGQKFILVAGSKGKGSTARLISSLLSHLGWKVGLFTSPHLVAFNERIRIDGKAIPDGDFIRLANEILGPFTEIESGLRDDEYQGPIGLALA
ncbi:MAG: bifunctional folylpolyglutamate synthase/dihydrofolate synthase, partial [Bacillaceae bacterium]|nr:bifunctional folylpolyglutamate synthase/dihydrofolate synthase [Bacillaceae bacterium]